MKKSYRTIVLALALVIAVSSSTTAFALTPDPERSETLDRLVIFPDVEKDSYGATEIFQLALNGAFAGVYPQYESLRPDRLITRGEFCEILYNLYGDNLKLSKKTDIVRPEKIVTSRYANIILKRSYFKLTGRKDCEIGVTVSKHPVSRREAAIMIYKLAMKAPISPGYRDPEETLNTDPVEVVPNRVTICPKPVEDDVPVRIIPTPDLCKY